MIEVRLFGTVNRPGLKRVDESITFKELLEDWRAKGDLEGLELEK